MNGPPPTTGPATWSVLIAKYKLDSLSDTKGKGNKTYATINWQELLARVVAPQTAAKGEGAFMVPSIYAGWDGRLSAPQVAHGAYPFICADVDGQKPLTPAGKVVTHPDGSPLTKEQLDPLLTHITKERMVAALRRLFPGGEWVIYGTSSSTAERPRWRIVIRLAELIPGADYVDHALALIALLGRDGIQLDRSSARSVQAIYLPSRREDIGLEGYDYHIEPGNPVVLPPSHPIMKEVTSLKAERAAAQRAIAANKLRREREAAAKGSNDVIGLFNASHSIASLLEKYRYVNKRDVYDDHPTAHWRSPYQTSGGYSTEDRGDHWISLSDSDAEAGLGAVTINNNRFGDAFDLSVHFEYGGNFTKAVADLHKREKPLPELTLEQRLRAKAAQHTPTPNEDPDTGEVYPDEDEDDLESLMEADAQNALADLMADRAPRGGVDNEVLSNMPKGGLRDIANACMGMMFTPTPEMAVMAALMGASALSSGYVVDNPAGVLSLNVWAVGLANTGTGKSYIDRAIGSMLNTVGVQPGVSLTSSEGLHAAMIQRTPDSEARPPRSHVRTAYDGKLSSAVMPLLIDEVAGLLGQVGNTGSVSAKDPLMATMLSWFTLANGPRSFITEAVRADSRNSRPRVNNPYLTLAAFSTPQAYHRVLSSDTVLSGWGTRVLHFRLAYIPEDRLDKVVLDLPEAVVGLLQELEQGCWSLGARTGKGGSEEFYAPVGSDWHRWMRRIHVADVDFRRARAAEKLTQRTLLEEGLEPLLANRLAEQSMKIAGLGALLDVAAAASVFGEWPDQIVIPPRWMDYGIWLATRLIMGFATERANVADAEAKFLDPEKVLGKLADIVRRPGHYMAQPSHAKRTTLAELKSGNVPHIVLARVLHAGAGPLKTAIETLVGQGEIDVVNRVKKGARTTGGTGFEGVAYRLR